MIIIGRNPVVKLIKPRCRLMPRPTIFYFAIQTGKLGYGFVGIIPA